jgi:cation-transporting ATPase I
VRETALTGNVLGGLLASVGSASAGSAGATRPGKSAAAFNLAWGAWSALRFDAAPSPPPPCTTPWHAP